MFCLNADLSDVSIGRSGGGSRAPVSKANIRPATSTVQAPTSGHHTSHSKPANTHTTHTHTANSRPANTNQSAKAGSHHSSHTTKPTNTQKTVQIGSKKPHNGKQVPGPTNKASKPSGKPEPNNGLRNSYGEDLPRQELDTVAAPQE